MKTSFLLTVCFPSFSVIASQDVVKRSAFVPRHLIDNVFDRAASEDPDQTELAESQVKTCKERKKKKEDEKSIVPTATMSPSKQPKSKKSKAPSMSKAPSVSPQPPSMSPFPSMSIAPSKKGKMKKNDDDDLPYCVPFYVSTQELVTDCNALAAGELPMDENKVDGVLQAEIAYLPDQSSETVLDKVHDVLRQETSPLMAGCVEATVRRDRRQLISNNSTNNSTNDTNVTILGVGFSNLTTLNDTCTRTVATGYVCEWIESNVTIYYSGEEDAILSDDEVELLFLKLDTTVADQMEDGSFSDIGEIDYVVSEPLLSASTIPSSAFSTRCTSTSAAVVSSVTVIFMILQLLLF